MTDNSAVDHGTLSINERHDLDKLNEFLPGCFFDILKSSGPLLISAYGVEQVE